MGVVPKLASGSLLLVGIKPSPTIVGPLLLLGLLLLLLLVPDPLACVLLPVLSSLDVLAQQLIDVGGVHIQLAHLPSQSGETSGRSCTSRGPLELELVDRCPEAYHAHSVELALCHDKPPASYCYG